ncbi:hypothetical protein KU620_24435, partial [Salmonella enterica subsp. enterica serovar Mbandaka]|nr:hypothetical protein [Salmonella enterica subsp. enterica serovar Mbandaka]
CICLLGGVVMLMVNPSVIGAFTMITTVSAILFMFVWTIILCSSLAYAISDERNRRSFSGIRRRAPLRTSGALRLHAPPYRKP